MHCRYPSPHSRHRMLRPRAKTRFPLLVFCVLMVTLSTVSPPAAAEGPRFHPDTNLWWQGHAGPVENPLPTTNTTAPPEPAGANNGDRTVEWTISANLPVHPAETGQHIWVDIAQAPDGLLGVAWMDDHAPGGYHIFYCQSLDGGGTWSTPEQVDDRYVGGAYSKFVSLAFTPAGTALAVWEDDRAGQIQLYFSRRIAGPAPTWTPAVQVNTHGGSPTGSDFMNGSLTVLDEQRYFVAWTDWREGVFHQVYMRGTWDGGTTWGPESRVSDGLGYQPVAGTPCLVVDLDSGPVPGQERLYCVTNDWRGNVPGGRYPNVYSYRSVDGGATWSVGVRVNDIEPYYQQTASRGLVQLGDGSLAAGWLNDPDFSGSRYHVNVSSDGGATWGASVRVSEPALGSNDTYDAIATSGGWLFAAFAAYLTDWNVYMRASSDGGLTWTEPSVRVDDDVSGAPAHTPVLVASAPNEVTIAWQDGRAPGNNWKIYAATATAQTTAIEPIQAGDVAGRAMLRAIPNPSRVGSRVLLRLVDPVAGSHRTPANTDIYDVHGRLIRRLQRGPGLLVWDGRDELGHQVPAGCYFVHDLHQERYGSTVLVRIR